MMGQYTLVKNRNTGLEVKEWPGEGYHYGGVVDGTTFEELSIMDFNFWKSHFSLYEQCVRWERVSGRAVERVLS
jgi:hypothetical protein